MTPRTSQSDPLRIAEVSAPGARGTIGITFCPGKKQALSSTGAWDRDLGVDLDAIRTWGASTVITLVEDHELEELGVRALGAEVAARGMAWLHLPITDVSPPDHRFEHGWREHAPRLVHDVRAGGRVLVHCKGGLGRAGTAAALLLVALDVAPAQAIRIVRAARAGAIETAAQESYVLRSTRMPPPDLP